MENVARTTQLHLFDKISAEPGVPADLLNAGVRVQERPLLVGSHRSRPRSNQVLPLRELLPHQFHDLSKVLSQ